MPSQPDYHTTGVMQCRTRRIRAAAVVSALVCVSVGCGSGLERSTGSVQTTHPEPPGTTGLPGSTTTSVAAPTTGPTTSVAAPTTGPTTSVAAPPGTGDPLSGWTPPTLDWTGCSGNVECAQLAVPLDWARPDGTQISLALVRIPSTGDRIGSLLINPGGPGGSGTAFVRSRPLRSDPLDDVSARFDIVGWDPRGVGQSTHVSCGTDLERFLHLDSSPDTSDERQELDDTAAEVARRCASSSGELLPFVGTDNTVTDMEAIRLALGEDRLTFLGYSYGTELGALYADRFGPNVRAIVLDGVVDPTHDLPTLLAGQTRQFDAVLTRVLGGCGDDCPLGDGPRAYDELAGRLEADPMTDDDGRILGPQELAVAATSIGYSAAEQSEFIPALRSALDGDPAPMIDLSESYYDLVGFDSYVAIECADGPHPTNGADWDSMVADLTAISPRLGPSVGNELRPCAHWPVPPTHRPRVVHAAAAPPILVIGTTGDPATPYSQAVRVAGDLAHARLVTFDGEGHTAVGRSDCVDRAVARYLIDLRLPGSDVEC